MGTLSYANGEKYVGGWKDGNYNGMGTYTWPNGQKYVGELKGLNMNGKGVLFKINGDIISGIWVDNSFKDVWTIEAVRNYLSNRYPQFKEFDFEPPTTSGIY